MKKLRHRETKTHTARDTQQVADVAGIHSWVSWNPKPHFMICCAVFVCGKVGFVLYIKKKIYVRTKVWKTRLEGTQNVLQCGLVF